MSRLCALRQPHDLCERDMRDFRYRIAWSVLNGEYGPVTRTVRRPRTVGWLQPVALPGPAVQLYN